MITPFGDRLTIRTLPARDCTNSAAKWLVDVCGQQYSLFDWFCLVTHALFLRHSYAVYIEQTDWSYCCDCFSNCYRLLCVVMLHVVPQLGNAVNFVQNSCQPWDSWSYNYHSNLSDGEFDFDSIDMLLWPGGSYQWEFITTAIYSMRVRFLIRTSWMSAFSCLLRIC